MIVHIFDIDGTLITLPKTDFTSEDFNWNMWLNDSWDQSTVIEETVLQYSTSLDSNITDVWLVTARPEKWRRDTELQLMKLGIWDHRSRLVMRPDDECDAETRVVEKLQASGTREEVEHAVKSLIHEGHAKYRHNVMTALNTLYAPRTEYVAWDDQITNLDAFLAHGVRGHLVDGGES